MGDGVNRLVDAIKATTTKASAGNPQDLLNAGAALADAVISVSSVLTLIFFWLTGHQHMQRFALALLPAPTAARRARGVERGRVATGPVGSRPAHPDGLHVRGDVVAYFVMGLEGALFLGLLAGIAEVIPIVGPTLGAVPALLVALTSGRIELVCWSRSSTWSSRSSRATCSCRS